MNALVTESALCTAMTGGRMIKQMRIITGMTVNAAEGVCSP
jgi:hypothetical protein